MSADESRFYGHPQVSYFCTDRWGNTSCYVAAAGAPSGPDGGRSIYVREVGPYVLADNPKGDDPDNHHFNSLDEGIEWALSQAGGPR